MKRDLWASCTGRVEVFSPGLVSGLPEPARRYLLHAIAPGTPLAHAVNLHLNGSMWPDPAGPRIDLSAEEVLAPRRGFVWAARARMLGLPVHVRDHYFERRGGVDVTLLGIVPVSSSRGPDVVRSSRGRLVAEAVWCPTALAGLGVTWEGVDEDRARFTARVDGEAVPVTVRVGPDGALRDVTLGRWGDVGVPTWEEIPYGFEAEEEATFGGITIPSRLRGGWYYGTDRYNPTTASAFSVRSATFAGQ